MANYLSRIYVANVTTSALADYCAANGINGTVSYGIGCWTDPATGIHYPNEDVAVLEYGKVFVDSFHAEHYAEMIADELLNTLAIHEASIYVVVVPVYVAKAIMRLG